jgi:hypothetical protein
MPSRWPRAALLPALAVALALGAAACAPRRPAVVVPTAPLPIMGKSRLTPGQLAAWFTGRQPRLPGVYAATIPIEILARYYVEEGAAEGIAGDVAFVQAVVETGWFRFSSLVPGSLNNFGGIGATDTDPSPAAFPDARTGVRAQIQHLRAYADPAARECAEPPLHHPCVDPRYEVVAPKGKAPVWNLMGRGNWATSPAYGAAILQLYADARAFRAPGAGDNHDHPPPADRRDD